jgi:ankyrin repeat protein
LSSGEETRSLLPSLASLGVGTGMDADERETQTRRSRSLLNACVADDADQVRTLLAEGAAVNPEVAGSVTPLHVACERGHADCATLLLEAGADASACDYFGRTPLMNACRMNNSHCVRLLLRAGADVDTTRRLEGTALHAACKNGHADCAVLLLEYGADPNARRTNDGKTPLHLACEVAHSPDCAKVLLKYGADPNARDDAEDATPLRHAIYWAYVGCARVLLKAGADVLDAGIPLALDGAQRAIAASRRAQANVWGMLSRFQKGEGEKHWATEEVLRALLLAEARRAGCALGSDAAESVLRAVASQ